MEFTLDKTVSILERTPTVLNSMLIGLDPAWIDVRENEKTWSPLDILCHLIYGEYEDWIERTQIILNEGASRPFKPFDPEGFLEIRVMFNLETLLDQFQSLRAANLLRLGNLKLTKEQLDLKGIHPDLGEVTLRNHLATWATHDLSHIAQICRVMSRQYGDAMGPWQSMFPILADR